MTKKDQLTDVQKRMLWAIKRNTFVRRVGPTYEQLQAETGIPLSTLNWEAVKLEKAGWLEPRRKDQHRQLLIKKGKKLPKK